MKLTIFLISGNKQLYTKPLFLNINWIWRWCHVGHFTKLCLRQRRLCNIVKTTNAIALIKGMSESVSKFPQTPWKMTNLKESLHFSQAAQVLATFTYVSVGQKWKKNSKIGSLAKKTKVLQIVGAEKKNLKIHGDFCIMSYALFWWPLIFRL